MKSFQLVPTTYKITKPIIKLSSVISVVVNMTALRGGPYIFNIILFALIIA